MKKITKVMALMLVIAMVLSGCATGEETYKINANNKTVIMNSKIEVDKTKCLTVMKKMDPTLKNDTEADKALRELVKESYGSMGYAYSVSTTKKDNTDYYVISLRKTQSIDAFNEENAISGTEYISTEAFYYSTESEVMPSDSEMFTAYKEMGITEDDIKSVKLKTTIEFPNKIVSSKNGTINETNPNVITFEYGMEKATVLFATTNSNITVESIKKEMKDKYEIQMIKGVKKPSIKSVKVTSVKKKKGTVKVTIKTVKNATYEVQYSTNKNFKKAKIKKTKKATVTIKNLKAGKKYYFRVRAVAIPKDNYVYQTDISKYSKKKSIVIKKSKKK